MVMKWLSKNMYWLISILGGLLMLAPFISGYHTQPGLFCFSLFAGTAIMLFGWLELFRCAAVSGLIVLFWPWIIRFSSTPAASWFWMIGAVTVLLAAYEILIMEHAGQPHRSRSRDV